MGMFRWPGLLLGVALIAALASLQPWLAQWDALLTAPEIDPDGTLGWVLRVIAVVTSPVVLYSVWVVLAAVFARSGLRTLAATLLLGSVLAASAHQVIRALVRRPRPPSLFAETITYVDFAFPSGHMTGVAASAGLLGVTAGVLRLSRRWRWAAAGAIAVVAVNRWAINAHWISDLVTGTVLGFTAAALAVVLARPRRLPAQARGTALVYHPGRLPGWLASRVAPGALLLPTTAQETGSAQARAALAAGVSRVLVAGGDGTLRQVAGAVAGTQTPVGILPLGSGNVLAASLGIPPDLAEASRLGLNGEARRIDVLTVTLDGREETCLTMAGVGADAAVLRDTSDSLKWVAGPLAYLLAGFGHLRPRPLETTVGRVSQVLIGNVAGLSPGLTFFPGADPCDGEIEMLTAAPRSSAEVMGCIGAVLRGRGHHRTVTVSRARTHRVGFGAPALCHVDGDVAGEVSTLSVSADRCLLVVSRAASGG